MSISEGIGDVESYESSFSQKQTQLIKLAFASSWSLVTKALKLPCLQTSDSKFLFELRYNDTKLHYTKVQRFVLMVICRKDIYREGEVCWKMWLREGMKTKDRKKERGNVWWMNWRLEKADTKRGGRLKIEKFRKSWTHETGPGDWRLVRELTKWFNSFFFLFLRITGCNKTSILSLCVCVCMCVWECVF